MSPTHATVPSPGLTAADVAVLRQDLAAYHALYAPLFPRREQRAPARCYLEGLLSEARRKSVERMVRHLRGADPNAVRTAPMFVGQGRGQEEVILARHWQEVARTLGTPDGVLIGDGSDLPQQGRASVGVARQYCGELGKTAHGQAGVCLGSARARGATRIPRRLSLPRPWVEDPAWAARRRRGGVPVDRIFQTQPQWAAALVAEVVAAGTLPVRGVTCDEGYGQNPAFRDRLAALGLGYLAEVPHTTRVWPRLAPGEPRAQVVRDVAAPRPPGAWPRWPLPGGSRGPRYADFAARRVVASRRQWPGPDVWRLLRRHPDTHGLKTCLAHGPAALPRDTLVGRAGMRWPIATCFREGKPRVGLGDYEGRRGTGWHHHMTLCLRAHFFRVRPKARWPKKPRSGPYPRCVCSWP